MGFYLKVSCSFEGEPIWLNVYITVNQFTYIITGLSFTDIMSPYFKEKFFESIQMIFVWKYNTNDFHPVRVSYGCSIQHVLVLFKNWLYYTYYSKLSLTITMTLHIHCVRLWPILCTTSGALHNHQKVLNHQSSM